ncbi:amino acid adenylation domain-containing protein [Streptomyces sp. M2CJ-2]|uniref:amino acid adenylation domain-containing protein n=1 Tax=Streptomyces sp. M2CJ-2 TaxID=2803948 RepID=UPI00192845FD|nr:amino acid adenylation domain-containing protein [Streptomyces sp. M2CJ-2]MBL3669467.1 amino acid adenylation domain-containing protein [Streptomyces sp. M2CJ-2]
MVPAARYRVAAPITTDRRPGSQAKACHSLVVRVRGPVDPAALHRRFHEAAARWPGQTVPQLWEETLPTGSTDPAALARVRREAGRPVSPAAGFPLRAVLLRYADGEADLVLVALRPVVDGRALHGLAGLLLDGSADLPEPGVGEIPRHQEAARRGAGGTRPELEWGLGDPARAGRTGEVTLELPDGLRPADTVLVGAVGLVLARYESAEATAVGVFDADGAGGDISVLRASADGTQRVGDYLAQWHGPYGGEPVERQPLPGVGVVLGRSRPGFCHRPFLAPVLPVTLHWERDRDDAVAGTLLYDEGAVAPEVARSLACHVAHVAVQLASGPDRGLDSVELMTEAETLQTLRAGAVPATGSAVAAGRTIHGLFEDVAHSRPDAVALTAGDTELTYAELNARAGLLAAGLRALGVGRGDLVGVALERDAELVVTLLAVLKAGCAYVPMDVRYPEERLRYTMESAGAALVVGAADAFPAVDGVRVVGPDELRALGEARSDEDGPAQDTGDGASAAYVIYTSGSTGRPKGVVVPHRNVAALVEATREDFGLGADDVWTLFHSCAFDFSVWEIWGCLLTGGRLVVVPYWVTRDTELFHELLVRQRVTVLNQTPSAFAQLVETDRRSADEVALRLVVFGGEPLDVRVLAPWFARHSPTRCRLVNMFGITETTVHVTAHTVTPADVVAGSRSVGRALPGWSLSVRDPHGRVLPPGAAGEICVGGAGVADRYLGQPELTAERFVTDPFGGGRIYRSGDRGRLRPDGRLDHLGRLDSQVKVRGHRIELDEIRNVLLGHPEVVGAAAVLNHEVPGDAATARIDAYVVLRNAVATVEVLAHARGVLPAYMLPASVTAVPAIPLTINGKLDAAALPAPAVAVPRQQEATTAAPVADGTVDGAADGGQHDPVADEILKLWSHALNTEVGLDDNFFELGGNSLLVIRLLREMRDRGLPRIATQDFYRNSTASRFIEIVREQKG